MQLDKNDNAGSLVYMIEKATALPMTSRTRSNLTIMGSRSHPSPELSEYIERKRREYDRVDFISAGSSLKLCAIAEGSADIYPRLGPTMEWDIAAGQAIVEESGGTILDYEKNEPLIYNKKNLLNPWFLARRADFK